MLTALRDGHGEQVRSPAPSADELRERLVRELTVSLAYLRDRTEYYADRRFQPGKLEPVADALWRARATSTCSTPPISCSAQVA